LDGKRRSTSFQDVELWKKAHAWVLAVYRFTERFPKCERFGLDAQLRDAALSVPGNFAEGFNGDATPLLKGAEEIARMFEGYVQSMSRPACGSRASEHRFPGIPY
jgi:hypothetical protein